MAASWEQNLGDDKGQEQIFPLRQRGRVVKALELGILYLPSSPKGREFEPRRCQLG